MIYNNLWGEVQICEEWFSKKNNNYFDYSSKAAKSEMIIKSKNRDVYKNIIDLGIVTMPNMIMICSA